MNRAIFDHYLAFGTFTNPGMYKQFLQVLPDDVKELGALISHQVIHRVTLKEGNTQSNEDLRYGDMKEYPWHRLRCDDDVLPTAVSMIAELLRLDDRGLLLNRKIEHKIVVTCRFIAVLMASILKSKGIPCRVRSGFASYLSSGSWDHWINQYWNDREKRWITFDADGFFAGTIGFDQYDIPAREFDWAATTWLGIRSGELDEQQFKCADGSSGLMPVLWAIFYDFHSLMNNEILYAQMPSYVYFKFDELSEDEFEEIDALARLLLDPDANFEALLEVWNTKRKFRLLNGPLISDYDHIKCT